MIRVAIAAHLLEQCLRSGFKMGYLLEVINGLPMNAQLTGAEMNKERGVVYLHFSQPNVPDSEWSDLEITLKSIRAIPIDLDKVPAPKPKVEPIVVERNIG